MADTNIPLHLCQKGNTERCFVRRKNLRAGMSQKKKAPTIRTTQKSSSRTEELAQPAGKGLAILYSGHSPNPSRKTISFSSTLGLSKSKSDYYNKLRAESMMKRSSSLINNLIADQATMNNRLNSDNAKRKSSVDAPRSVDAVRQLARMAAGGPMHPILPPIHPLLPSTPYYQTGCPNQLLNSTLHQFGRKT